MGVHNRICYLNRERTGRMSVLQHTDTLTLGDITTLVPGHTRLVCIDTNGNSCHYGQEYIFLSAYRMLLHVEDCSTGNTYSACYYRFARKVETMSSALTIESNAPCTLDNTKAGDVVMCVDPYENGYFTEGKTYIVKSVSRSSIESAVALLEVVENDRGNSHKVYARRFRHYTPTITIDGSLVVVSQRERELIRFYNAGRKPLGDEQESQLLRDRIRLLAFLRCVDNRIVPQGYVLNDKNELCVVGFKWNYRKVNWCQLIAESPDSTTMTGTLLYNCTTWQIATGDELQKAFNRYRPGSCMRYSTCSELREIYAHNPDKVRCAYALPEDNPWLEGPMSVLMYKTRNYGYVDRLYTTSLSAKCAALSGLVKQESGPGGWFEGKTVKSLYHSVAYNRKGWLPAEDEKPLQRYDREEDSVTVTLNWNGLDMPYADTLFYGFDNKDGTVTLSSRSYLSRRGSYDIKLEYTEGECFPCGRKGRCCRCGEIKRGGTKARPKALFDPVTDETWENACDDCHEELNGKYVRCTLSGNYVPRTDTVNQLFVNRYGQVLLLPASKAFLSRVPDDGSTVVFGGGDVSRMDNVIRCGQYTNYSEALFVFHDVIRIGKLSGIRANWSYDVKRPVIHVRLTESHKTDYEPCHQTDVRTGMEFTRYDAESDMFITTDTPTARYYQS